MARPKAQKNFPKLHNATWPGVVGKGFPDNPVIELRQMLEPSMREFTSTALTFFWITRITTSKEDMPPPRKWLNLSAATTW